MLNNVFLKTLRDQRRSLLFWGIGLVALAVIMALVYPTISSMQSINQYLEELPEGMKEMFGGGILDYTSPVGYFSTELYSFMLPLLLLVFGIGFGAAAIAGEEEKGTLDFLLANPVPRWRVVIEKFGVMAVSMILLSFIFWAGLAISVVAIGIDISLYKLAEATIGALMLAMVFAAFSFLLGCLKGNRGMSLGITCGLAVLTYFLNTLGSMVNGLKDYRFLSPFYHYMEPNTLKNGTDPVHMLVLLVLVLVFLVVSIPAFNRRDIAV
ncbi:MAG: ABC transporter permease subunit [Dehalococcoidales bacterium]|nr:ABC transporter permease subunit [Dehalococcoidales bacterium]